MDETQIVNEVPIAPVYAQSEPNQPVELGVVAVEYKHQEAEYQDSATVRMRFLPSNRLEFVCPLASKSPLLPFALLTDKGDDIDLGLTGRGVRVMTFFGGTNDSGLLLLPRYSGFQARQPSTTIASAVAHLFNFPDFFGPEDYLLKVGERGWMRCGQVNLTADGWSVTIAAFRESNALIKQLAAKGGYVITHAVRISREDAGTFSSEQFDELLTCLHYFLSFALGRWAGVALPVGYDAEGNIVHEEWGTRSVADGKWNGSTSWFDAHHPELLREVFPGFMTLWKNPVWREPLMHSIYWYLGACDRRVGIGVDAGLILAQTALELLAWTHCVLDRKLVSQKAFTPSKLDASDKVRMLVTSLDIPAKIPAELTGLKGRPGKKWDDALDALTGVRNSLVHPDNKSTTHENTYYDAWRLALWYIDLIILKLCGHNGNYANRLVARFVGEVESVPWSRTSQK
jgi:hypothetical protein